MRIAVILLLLAGTAVGQELPSWLKLGGSYRAREESTQSVGFEHENDWNYYLGRLRIDADMTPHPGLEFYLEGQDARVAGLSDEEAAEGLRNQIDVRQAWMRLGPEHGPWQLQLGRQELAFGDERLVGADHSLDPLGFTWDAARLTYTRGALTVTSFGAWKVSAAPRSMDRTNSHDRLYGVYFTLPAPRKGLQIEPYFLLNEQIRHCHENELVTNRVGVLGLRSIGNLTHTLDYNFEMAAERGQFNNQAMRSWAGHWELGWRIGPGDHAPRLRAEYNLASGDKHPNDNVHSTFDDLYPAGYNAFGMADPFAWRNIRNPSVRMEVPLKKNWTVMGGWRWYSLDSVHDGLYTVGDECLARNLAASSSRVGQQLSMAVSWEPSPQWKVDAGYARFFSGPYLQQSGLPDHLSTPYVSLAFSF